MTKKIVKLDLLKEKLGPTTMFPENTDLLAETAIKADLEEGTEGIRNVLLHMYRNPLSNKELARVTGIAVPVLSAVRGELRKAGILEEGNIFSGNGVNYVEKTLGFQVKGEIVSLEYNFQSNVIPRGYEFLVKHLSTILKNRPKPDYSLDQSRSTLETVIKRGVYMLSQGDIEGRKILILGDDDCLSLCIGVIGYSKEITVVDIDKRILEFIKDTSEELGVKNLSCIHHDLKEPLPEHLKNKYDVFQTDPPYTVPGFKLFCSRGLESLRKTPKLQPKRNGRILSGLKGYISFGHRFFDEMWEVQEAFIRMGFRTKEIIPGFNRYQGATIIGNVSQMIQLETTAFTKLPSPGMYPGKIYTSEFKKKKYEPTPPIDETLEGKRIQSLGYHLIGEFFEVERKFLEKSEELSEIILSVCQDSGLTVIGEPIAQEFSPQGITIVTILSESAIMVHTWPEHSFASVDIFSCSKRAKTHQAFELLRTRMNPKKFTLLEIERGTPSSI